MASCHNKDSTTACSTSKVRDMLVIIYIPQAEKMQFKLNTIKQTILHELNDKWHKHTRIASFLTQTFKLEAILF